MIRIEEIVSDKELQEVFENTNYGKWTPREVVRDSLLKRACFFHTGFTSQQILVELKLITPKTHVPTKKGREYLFFSFSKDHSTLFN